MKYEAVLTFESDTISKDHLLQHYQNDILQEDICFALWRPSTGADRYSALVYQIILPEADDRLLHGNASFEPKYLARAIEMARDTQSGIAFMHSHPSAGWQGMSSADVEAEHDVIAYPAGATELPLLGMTIGIDGYWSARFWIRNGKQMDREWCTKVRIVEPKHYRLQFNDNLVPPKPRKDILRRTYDTWGSKAQNDISRLKVCIVGVGSVGCIVAEAMARIGVGEITLIDPDVVEEHNLDRLLYGTINDIGKYKVGLAEEKIRRHSTASDINIVSLPVSIHTWSAYKTALDCDIIFSCVDRPVARDVLNFIAQAHLIPVIDGGIAVETDRMNELFSAHWRAHIVTPYHQCMRCNKQYDTSMVVMELDGSLDDPVYITTLPPEAQGNNQNVFPFSLSLASMEVNLLLRYLLARDWWPLVEQQDYQFLSADMRIISEACSTYCSFRNRIALGDTVDLPFYIQDTNTVGDSGLSWYRKLWQWMGKIKSKGKDKWRIKNH